MPGTPSKPFCEGAPNHHDMAQARPSRPLRLKEDPERFPGLRKHPELERALRIHHAMLLGHPRDEAIALADQAMGPRALHLAQAAPGKAVQGKKKASAKSQTAPRKPTRRS